MNQMAYSGSVLIIEDDDAIRTVLKMALELDNYLVSTASNGSEGLISLQRGLVPGLILLDLMMPVMNGWEFITALEREPLFREVPVIAVTALAEEAQVIPRVCGVLKKPIDLDKLSEILNLHLPDGRSRAS